MYTRTFTDIAQRYAAGLGRNASVSVVFRGTVACTNGNLVVIPSMPAGTCLSPYQEKVYGGYLDHEISHVRRTDWVVLTENIEVMVKSCVKRQANPQHKTPCGLCATCRLGGLRKTMFNLVEDVRIENLQIGEYPGSKGFLDALAWEVDKQSVSPKKAKVWSERVSNLIYKEMWAVHRGCDTMTVDGWLSDYDSLLPLQEMIGSAFKKMLSSWDAWRLAVDVVEFLEKLDLNPPPESKSSAGKEVGPGEASGPFGGKEKPQGDSDDSSPQKKEDTKSRGEKIEEFQKAMGQGKTRQEVFSDLLEAIVEVNEDLGTSEAPKSRMVQGTVSLPPVTTEFDRVMIPASMENLDLYKTERAGVSAGIQSVKKVTQIYLQSIKHKTWSKGLEEGVLDMGALHSMSWGNSRLYKQKRERRFMDTALEVVLDLSSSMNRSILRRAAILLAEATSGIKGLSVQICGFRTNGMGSTGYSGPSIASGLGRWDGVDIPVFKAFGEPYFKCRGKIGAIMNLGKTPLGDGYGYAFEALLQRKERRRILWVVSDGEPCVSVQDHSHSEFKLMEQIQSKCKRSGIQTLGLGIGRHLKIREYFDVYEEVVGPDQLEAAVLKILKETLT